MGPTTLSVVRCSVCWICKPQMVPGGKIVATPCAHRADRVIRYVEDCAGHGCPTCGGDGLEIVDGPDGTWTRACRDCPDYKQLEIAARQVDQHRGELIEQIGSLQDQILELREAARAYLVAGRGPESPSGREARKRLEEAVR